MSTFLDNVTELALFLGQNYFAVSVTHSFQMWDFMFSLFICLR